MRISDVLDQKSVFICKNESSKKRVLEILSEHLAKLANISRSDIFQKFIERERIGSTALGNAVALPHIRIANLKSPMAVFLLLKPGVDFESPDNELVNLVFGLIVPEEANEEHLKILSQVAELFYDRNLRDQLNICQDEAPIYALLTGKPSLIEV